MRPSRDSRLARFILGVFFLAAIGYGLFEAQGVLYGPEIRLVSHMHTSTSSLTYVRGEALRMSELRINGRKVAVTELGAFNEPHILAPGSNHITLEAKDARGRTDTKELVVLYTGTSTTPTTVTPDTIIEPMISPTTTATSTAG